MKDTDADDPATPAPQKRPYTTPGPSWEEPFEVHTNLASACGKFPLGGGSCNTFPDAS
jgi:hypothetical protein